ncbi:Asp23/Gls24 family envelope stress response protein [Streptomyces sp. BB1-1-1]|uniref:Asp23/Gls24 family envelope stress response protein n=1 Tax=Streptomyces sp. BB1-1-1 TaxID=3074430 RepID=UPI002877D178|nr:Asp23/Gls24 family envelope stress response protein [Streptomyces sp. BB1-1-1]WND34189.1 Asp23/Gls24 family envelope stress response protein [Streptomyces sp. BB1-1-1]
MTAAATGRDALAGTVARVTADVPGVAFLRPGLVDLFRGSARTGPPLPAGRTSAGVRVTRASGTGPWEVDVQVVVHRGHRALTVARAVRDAVATALAETAPGAQVTVTVTNAV